MEEGEAKVNKKDGEKKLRGGGGGGDLARPKNWRGAPLPVPGLYLVAL